jgi:hypothetical protein
MVPEYGQTWRNLRDFSSAFVEQFFARKVTPCQYVTHSRSDPDQGGLCNEPALAPSVITCRYNLQPKGYWTSWPTMNHVANIPVP